MRVARLVERMRRLATPDPTRRDLLERLALGATALSVAPMTYALRPVTATAAIVGPDQCPRGSHCTDGYTDFCCALSSWGRNLCPPGTVVAGWWKADGSGFCDIDGPRPRYYLDCNHVCDPGCDCGPGGICDQGCTAADCGCLDDDCNNRQIDCVRFRYGQCNQDIPCVGPIRCRIVTCVPPWVWDPSCTTAVATDNGTRFHDRACLHEGFTDVAPDAWYTGAVLWMAERGITTGFDDDLFGPTEPATRAQLVTFLWRYAGRPEPAGPAPFDDVDPSRYHARAVAWAAEKGLTTGVGDGLFAPDRTAGRAEVVAMLHRWVGSPSAPPGSTVFDDIEAGSWYDTAVGWAAEAGLTTGVAPGVFGPTLVVTRAEVAVFLQRFDTAGLAPVGGAS